MKVAICDDDIFIINEIEKYIVMMGIENNITITCEKFCSGEEFISENTNDYSIVFLDIEMKEMNGFEVAEHIRKTNQEITIIFATVFSKYSTEGYRYNAYRYLVKPLNYERFKFELEDLFININKRQALKEFLKKEKRNGMPSISNILYIEVIDHTVIYHTKDKEFETKGTMRKLEEIFKQLGFVRIHNSYIVNMSKIHTTYTNSLILDDKTELTISRNRKKGFEKAYLEYYMNLM